MSTHMRPPQIRHPFHRIRCLLLATVLLCVFSGCSDQKQQAESLVRTAIEHSESKQYAEAVQVLNRAVALNPGLAEAFYLRGTCQSKLNRLNESVSDLSAATRLKPTWDEAWCSLGVAQIQSGDSSSGLKSLTKALEFNPKSQTALEARIAVWKETGRATEELDDLNILVTLDQDNASALLRRAVLISKTDTGQAIEDFSRLIQLDRNNAIAWMERGLCYNRISEPDRALADLNIACRLQPDNYLPWLERGRILRAVHRPEDAISDLSRACTLAPAKPDCCKELGLAFLDASNIDAAESNLLQADRLSPDNSEIRLALRQIESARGQRTVAVETFLNLLDDADSLSYSELADARAKLAEQLHGASSRNDTPLLADDSESSATPSALMPTTEANGAAVDHAAQFISTDASRIYAILHRGKLNLEDQQWESAVADFTEFLSRLPNDREVLTLRARALIKLNQPAGAISDLSQAILQRPDAAELYVLRAEAFDQFNEPTAALADLQKAARLMPGDAELQAKTAGRLVQARQFAKATRLLDTIEEANAGQLSASLRLLRGQSRLGEGDFAGAEEDAKALTELNSSESKSLADDVLLLRAMIALHRRSDVEAVVLLKDVPESSLDSESLLLYGETLRRLQKVDESIRILTQVLDADAGNRRALVARAGARMDTADWQAAIDDANRALNQAPNDPDALQVKAICLFQNDRFREALDCLDKLGQLNIVSTESRWMRIRCCSELKLAFREMNELNVLLGILPTHKDARLLRASLLEQLGRLDDSIRDLDVAFEQDSRNVDIVEKRGILNQQQGNSKAARDDFTLAIELTPDASDLWYRRGIANSHLNDLDAAKADFDKAIQYDPESADAWYALGNIEASRGRADEAIAAYTSAVDIRPEHAAAWYNRGNVLFNQSRLQQAVDCWSIAIEIQPTMFRAWNNRAVAHDRMGQDEEAMADFEKTLELNSGFVRAWDSLAWLLATSDHKKVRDPERSVQIATKGCEVSGFEDWSCLNTLAMCCAENQDYPAALKWAKKAREVSPAEEHAELDQIITAYETQLNSKRVATSPGRISR